VLNDFEEGEAGDIKREVEGILKKDDTKDLVF